MLEAVDILTPGYVCGASIKDFDNQGNVQIHFDGWTDSESFFFFFFFPSSPSFLPSSSSPLNYSPSLRPLSSSPPSRV